MKFLRLLTFFIFTTVFSLCFISCRSVPYTNRSQMIFISEEQENELGRQAWAEILAKTRKSGNIEYNRALQRVGWHIAKQVKKKYDWEFVVFDNQEPNAFCLPGGKVGVFSGLFKYTANDAELASVVGHEVGHAIARHAGERISQQMLTSAWTNAFGILSGTFWVGILAASVLDYGVSLPYSRTHEYEADEIGVFLMAKAGYNPYAALDFWKKFAELSKGGYVSEFFSTHPVGPHRIEALKDEMPRALKYYQKSKVKYDLGVIY